MTPHRLKLAALPLLSMGAIALAQIAPAPKLATPFQTRALRLAFSLRPRPLNKGARVQTARPGCALLEYP